MVREVLKNITSNSQHKSKKNEEKHWELTYLCCRERRSCKCWIASETWKIKCNQTRNFTISTGFNAQSSANLFYFSNYNLLTKRRSESRTACKMSPQREANQRSKHNIQNSQFTASALTLFRQNLRGFPSRAQSVTTILLLATISVPFFPSQMGNIKSLWDRPLFFFLRRELGVWHVRITKKKNSWIKIVQWEPLTK